MRKIKITPKMKNKVSVLDIIRHDVTINYLATVDRIQKKTGLSKEFCSRLVLHDMSKRLPGIPAEGQKI